MQGLLHYANSAVHLLKSMPERGERPNISLAMTYAKHPEDRRRRKSTKTSTRSSHLFYLKSRDYFNAGPHNQFWAWSPPVATSCWDFLSEADFSELSKHHMYRLPLKSKPAPGEPLNVVWFSKVEATQVHHLTSVWESSSYLQSLGNWYFNKFEVYVACEQFKDRNEIWKVAYAFLFISRWKSIRSMRAIQRS